MATSMHEALAQAGLVKPPRPSTPRPVVHKDRWRHVPSMLRDPDIAEVAVLDNHGYVDAWITNAQTEGVKIIITLDNGVTKTFVGEAEAHLHIVRAPAQVERQQTSRAKSDARKRAKAERDRAIRLKMKSPKQGK